MEVVIDALRAHGSNVTEHGDKAQATCPAHDDQNPSLSISPRRDAKGALVYCHAGCVTAAVLAAVNLAPKDLFDDPQARRIYEPRRDYAYPGGRRVHRKPDKSFPQSGTKDDRSLYHADKITDSTTTVYWPEGEKDCEAIEAAGGVAVCSAMGAGKAHLAELSPLRGKHVVVVADKDDAGRKHAAQVAGLLQGTAASVRIMEAASGKDFADHFAAGLGLDDLVDGPSLVTDVTDVTDSRGGTPTSVDGARLLDNIRHFLARFVAYPTDHALTAHTLWIAHAHLMDCWESTPRLAFLSPEPGSGKSRALEVTEPLVPQPGACRQRHQRLPVPESVRPRRAANHPGRRDRHRVRPESQRERRHPRHV